ncbi:adenylate cyclase [Paenibacillus psychroresistens]|uniref:Adenylate cyclase n=1 Tax=Paenibacillus psychroresistens TaxID=1778678 RepID=A0A6B8RV40_9BACL|nr:F390 synthetase-related protein [Paenibacillus psychroresistens]QGQ99649.1 adenylate cyclase [Paenibacillus psychroresistens]
MLAKLKPLFYYLRAKYLYKWSDRASFEQWQERRILRHLAFVRQHSPFYRELWADQPLAEWRQFPLLDKGIMMENFDLLNTAGISKDEAFSVALHSETTRDFAPKIGNITVGLSSGTSGNRGLFLVSEQEQAQWAGTILAKVLPRSLLQTEHIAFFLRANSNLYQSVQRGRLKFSYYDLLIPIDQHIATLNQTLPTLLIAPPSVLSLLAEAANLKQLAIHPRKIISVAEVLDPLDRQRIEAAFEQTVHQIYQCTEGFLASSCHYGTLHLNEEYVHIEKAYLDEAQRKFVPIITDFTRFTQPIIRYRLNDILTEREGLCPCGSIFTAIETIEGRCDDLFIFPSTEDSVVGANGKNVIVFPDFITRAILNSCAEIVEYQAIQHANDRIEICYLLKEGASRMQAEESMTQSLSELFQKLHCQMPEICFSHYHFIPGIRKLRRVERRVVQ